MNKMAATSLLILATLAVHAQVPGTLSYQGILMQGDGITPIADGAHTIEFNFYNALSDGQPLDGVGNRTISVNTIRGLFTCVIGDGSTTNAPLPASIGAQQVFVGIKVDGGSELSPRAQLTTPAYAMQAQNAYNVSDNAITNAKLADGSVTNAKLADDIDASKITGGTMADSRLSSHLRDLADGSLTGSKVGSGIATGNLTGTVAVANGGTGASTAATARTNLGLGSLSTLSTITSTEIANGTIVDADIATNGITTAGKVSGNAITSGTIGGSTAVNTTGTIATTGNVGIGTSPSYPLHAVSTGSRTAYFVNNATTGSAYALRAEATGTSTGTHYGVYGTASGGATNWAGYFSGDVHVSGDFSVDNWNLTGSTQVESLYTADVLDFNLGSENVVQLYKATSVLLGSNYGLFPADGVTINLGNSSARWSDIYGVDGDFTGVLETGQVRPSANNSFSLGTSGLRWTTVYATNGTINTSDQRLKQGIETLRYGLNEILRLRPVSYVWKGEEQSKINLGFIAQEVMAVAPEAVEVPKNEDEYYGLNYTSLIPIAIKAIQEQQFQIESLKASNQKLEQRLAAIEAMLSKNTNTNTSSSTSSKP